MPELTETCCLQSYRVDDKEKNNAPEEKQRGMCKKKIWILDVTL